MGAKRPPLPSPLPQGRRESLTTCAVWAKDGIHGIAMDRLQRKCFIASAGLHLLLGAVLIFGPAFLAPGRRADRAAQANGQMDPAALQVFTLLPEPVASSQPETQSAAQPMPVPVQPQSKQPTPPKSGKIVSAPAADKNPSARNSKQTGRNPNRDRRSTQFEEIMKGMRQGPASATKVDMGTDLPGGD